jgi:hypothetical protein
MSSSAVSEAIEIASTVKLSPEEQEYLDQLLDMSDDEFVKEFKSYLREHLEGDRVVFRHPLLVQRSWEVADRLVREVQLQCDTPQFVESIVNQGMREFGDAYIDEYLRENPDSTDEGAELAARDRVLRSWLSRAIGFQSHVATERKILGEIRSAVAPTLADQGIRHEAEREFCREYYDRRPRAPFGRYFAEYKAARERREQAQEVAG